MSVSIFTNMVNKASLKKLNPLDFVGVGTQEGLPEA